MTRYTLYANVENPHAVDGGQQDHWTSFRAESDDQARRIASEKLAAWKRDFGGWSAPQLRNDDADRVVV